MGWYHLFWITGCAVGSAAAWIALLSRGVDARRGAILIALAAVAFTWGTRLHVRLEQLPVGEALVFRPTPTEVLRSGHHLPLGLASGGAVGAVAALALHLPWRPVADALALGAVVMISVGRVGCFVNGCCAGKPCSTFWRPLCMRPSEKSGIVPDGSDPREQRLHPLSAYFAVTAALLALLFVAMLRRGAPPGRMGTTFALAYPASSLLLEHLRQGNGTLPSGLMLFIPVSALVLTATWVLVRAKAHVASRRAPQPTATA
jgi:prolipoprotein diacylglyceryltransferase